MHPCLCMLMIIHALSCNCIVHSLLAIALSHRDCFCAHYTGYSCPFYARTEHHLGLSVLEPRWRYRGCVVAVPAMPIRTISPITTIHTGWWVQITTMRARDSRYARAACVCECVCGVQWLCVCECVCMCVFVCVAVRARVRACVCVPVLCVYVWPYVQ